MTSNNPFVFQDNRQKIGGFLSLKIAESKNIVQQVATNTVELSDAIFLYREEWLAEFGVINKTLAELKLEAQITPNGYLQSPSLKFSTEQDISPQDFQVWFQQKIQGRNLVVQMLNNNELVRTLSPMVMTYTYSGVSEYSQSNKYELLFSRAKIIYAEYKPTYKFEYRNVIYPITTLIKFVEVKINLLNTDYNCTLIEYENLETKKKYKFVNLANLKTGTYEFFFRCRNAPEFFISEIITINTEATSDLKLK